MAFDEGDWGVFQQRLIEGTRAAIREFAARHPEETVCAFAYDCDPSAGSVLTSFNTARAEAEFVRKTHERNVRHRREVLSKPAAWSRAFYQIKANRVLPFCDRTGDFAYQDFSEIRFPEWRELFEHPEYPEPSGGQDDYLHARAAAIFVRALDLLVEDGTFGTLRLASPTLLGVAFHDEQHCVVRMLRLPGDAETTTAP